LFGSGVSFTHASSAQICSIEECASHRIIAVDYTP
jgi:hypothetical protein